MKGDLMNIAGRTFTTASNVMLVQVVETSSSRLNTGDLYQLLLLQERRAGQILPYFTLAKLGDYSPCYLSSTLGAATTSVSRR